MYPMQMYFVNMAGDLDHFFMLSPIFVFLVKISKHLRTKGSIFYSWTVTAKNGLTMHGISIYFIEDE
jgi:hypothetical protein